jgi:glucose-1-phosphate thymidylyltransferase
MVIAADNFAELDLSDFIAGFDSNTALIAVHDVGDKEKACEINKACQLGVVIIEGNKVIRFDEKPREPTSSIVATGMYIFPTRIFPLLAEYCQLQKQDNLGNFISYLINIEPVHAYAFTQTWIDIGDEIKKGRLSVWQPDFAYLLNYNKIMQTRRDPAET